MSDSSTEDQSWHIGVDSVVVGEENRRRSADFDMGAFTISIRRPILLSLACGARDERQGGLFWVSGGPNLSFSVGRADADADSEATGRHSIRSRSAEIPSRATFLAKVASTAARKLLRGGETIT